MPAPRRGSPESTIFVDPRGGGRAMRLTWHDADLAAAPGDDDAETLVVISLWRGNLCVGSFRLGAHEVPDLVHALTAGLAPALRQPLGDTG
jgi:hypothetical protein